MTDQWKPNGDKWPQPAMVMVREVTQATDGYIANIGKDFQGEIEIGDELLHPMPPTITPEQQAVLDAAEVQSSAKLRMVRDRGPYDLACARTNSAVRAMLAAQQPVDPVKELREAWNDFETSRTVDANGDALRRLRAAIAALEAKS